MQGTVDQHMHLRGLQGLDYPMCMSGNPDEWAADAASYAKQGYKVTAIKASLTSIRSRAYWTRINGRWVAK